MKRSFRAPEYLQISTMDCGVGALACFLRGYDLDASYERLREACQTSVDGTSIEALETLATDLGIDAIQHLLPPDLMLSGLTERLPAIVVVRIPGQPPHFVTLWRRIGSWVHFMDPARGRAWQRIPEFEKSMFVTNIELDREVWRDWWAQSAFREALLERARRLLPADDALAVCRAIDAAEEVEHLACIDASLRLVAKADAAAPGKTGAWRGRLFDASMAQASNDPRSLPAALWVLRPTGDGGLSVTAGVALAVADAGWAPAASSTDAARARLEESATVAHDVLVRPDELRWNVWADLFRLLSPRSQWLAGLVVGLSMVFAVAAAMEILMLRAAAWDAARMFPVVWSRIGVAALAIVLLAILAVLEGLLAFATRTVGRELELRLREVTFSMLPRVDDDFVRSRPTGDLAYRAHNIELGRYFPQVALSLLRACFDLLVTVAALCWIQPFNLFVLLVGAAVLALLALLARTRLQELETRFQAHGSRLLELFLDSLRGFRPVRLHGYQAAFRREQDLELRRWRETGLLQAQATSLVQGTQSILTTLWLGAIFWRHVASGGAPRTFIIVAFWSLRLPAIVETIISQTQQYVPIRSSFLKLLEITRYSRVSSATPAEDDEATLVDDVRYGVSLEMRNAGVVVGGHHLLHEINVQIPPGQHVAIVGASGCGKSTLLSMILGFHTPAEGELLIGGRALTPENLAEVRSTIAWIDPAVQVWNGTFIENLEYAASGYSRRDFLSTLEAADLLRVLDGMDRGLDTAVGAEGRLLSGGEGQRLRLGRALLRGHVRLALLDEAFRGLERDTRERLAVRAREALLNATMLFVSHDVSHALRFDRVLVMDGGRIVEDGNPAELAGKPSRFLAMLEAERVLVGETWAKRFWRRIRVERGRLSEVS